MLSFSIYDSWACLTEPSELLPRVGLLDQIQEDCAMDPKECEGMPSTEGLNQLIEIYEISKQFFKQAFSTYFGNKINDANNVNQMFNAKMHNSLHFLFLCLHCYWRPLLLGVRIDPKIHILTFVVNIFEFLMRQMPQQKKISNGFQAQTNCIWSL